MKKKAEDPAAANGEVFEEAPTSDGRGETKSRATGGNGQPPLVRPKTGKRFTDSSRDELKPLSAPARELGKKIAGAWNAAVSSIIETGRLLIKAKEEHPGEFLAIVDQCLPFGPRTAQRLMKIAEHPVLSDATHVSHLPASWGTLDVLRHIPPDQMLMMFEDGTLDAEIERKAAQDLVERIKEDGIYFVRDFQKALNTLTVIRGQWADPKALARKLSTAKWGGNDPGIWLKWEESGDSGKWLVEFHAACQKVEQKIARDFEIYHEREDKKRAREKAEEAKRRKEIIASRKRPVARRGVNGGKRA